VLCFYDILKGDMSETLTLDKQSIKDMKSVNENVRLTVIYKGL